MNEYESYSDTVLYDVFYEAGTMLLGTLNHIQDLSQKRGDGELSKWAADESFALIRARRKIRSFDRQEQIAMIQKWNEQRAKLDRVLEPSQQVFVQALASA